MLNVFFLLFFTYSSLPSLDIVNDVMFSGAENTIHIKLNDADPENIILKVSIGTLRKINDSTYVYIPQSTEEEVKIKLYHKKIVCDIKVVSIRNLPEPTLRFEKEINGQVNRKDVSQPGRLLMEYEGDFPDNLKSPIYQFSCIITDSQGQFLSSKNIRGDAWDDKTVNDIKKYKNIGQILINNVMIKTNQGVRRLEITKTVNVVD